MQKQESGNNSGKTPTVGIALGAGGANGLAHIVMLEALDELSIRPHYISGSSIGAVIAALYASGKSGRELREMIEQFIISPGENIVQKLLNKDAMRWVEFIEIELGRGGLISSEGFISFLYENIKCDRFEDLEIPLKIVAADLWDRSQVVFESGELLPAIKASMALPGVFHPAVQDDRTLIDGGTVNPVPYDLLVSECDIVIGIDVIGERTKPGSESPSYFETVFNAAKVMQHTIMAEKRQQQEPDVYIAPQITDIRALEFFNAESVFKQSGPARDELKKCLSKLVDKG